MRFFITLLISLPLTLILISFALSNRDKITLSLWPFPYDMTIPIYLFGILCFILGLFIGATILSLRLSKLQWRELMTKRAYDKLKAKEDRKEK